MNLKFIIIPFYILLTCPVFSQTPSKPNILIIYVDDLGYGDVGCYGATGVKTPNIDKLAKNGLRFTDAHCTAATCTPSRFSLLTGSYAFRNNAAILPGDAPLLIRPGTPTLPSMLQKAGYNTAVIGKWHLGLGNGIIEWNTEISPGPLEIGFNYSFIIPATLDRVPCVYVENHRVYNLDPQDPIQVSYKQKIGNEPTGEEHPELLKVKADPEHSNTIINGISRIGYTTGGKAAWWKDEDMASVLLKKTDSFLGGNKNKPFFLYLSYTDIHVPRAPNAQFKGKSSTGIRGDDIVQMDWTTGEVMKLLEKHGLSKNTLVIFTSDNGPIVNDGYDDHADETLGIHKPGGPFKGGKYSAYEAGTRVSTIAWWPGVIKPAASDALISQADFYASFAKLTGQALNSSEAPDSYDVLPALLGRSQQGRKSMLEEAFTLALREGSWKYIAPQQKPSPFFLVNKKVETGLSKAPQLFNLKTDLSESKDIIAQFPAQATKMAAALKAIEDNPTRPGFSNRISFGKPALLNPDIDVVHYRFSIALTDNSDMIKGTAEINIKSLQNKTGLYFDLVQKQIQGKGMTVTAVEKNRLAVAFTQDSQHIKINSPLNSGEDASYTIHYEGIPVDGLIISKNMFGHRTFFADNWPNRAHNWIPCNDHLGDKASVEFIVTAPDHYDVISNGVLVEQKKLDGGMKLTHWKEDVPLATKIMVIGVADFAISNAGSVGTIPVSSWVFPENKDSGFVHYAIAKNILPWFIKNIGAYPYKKLADIQSKTIFGGMENASAIFYFEESVNSKTLEDLMTHEIAHQWFGNSATEKDWSQVWLSEGFATYMTHAYHESKYGADSLRKRMQKNRASIISFSRTRSTPVVDTSEQKNLMKLLNTNSYEKGGWVLHMLRQEVGDSLFWKAIRSYYSTYAGSNADSEDLRKIFEQVSQQNLLPFFRQWLYEPGHPKLLNEWSYDEMKKSLVIKVTQTQNKSFSFPLEIQFNDGNKIRIEKINITDKQTAFSFPVGSKPASVIFDPNVHLLFETSR